MGREEVIWGGRDGIGDRLGNGAETRELSAMITMVTLVCIA